MKVRAQLPEAQIVHLSRADDIFAELGTSLDAFTLTAERGSAWTLLHPELSVAVPLPGLVKVPLAYPIARKDETFATVVNTWIDLQDQGRSRRPTLQPLDPRTHRRREETSLVGDARRPALGEVAHQ